MKSINKENNFVVVDTTRDESNYKLQPLEAYYILDIMLHELLTYRGVVSKDTNIDFLPVEKEVRSLCYTALKELQNKYDEVETK